MAAMPPSDCAHCGLPLGRRPIAGAVDGVVHRFCCAGCWLAMQVTRASGEAGGAATILVRLGLAVFFAMNVMMLSAPSYVPHVYGGGDAAVDGPLFVWLRWLSAAFSLPVLALLGGPVLRAALAGLRGGRAGSDALIALGVGAAWVLSFANLVQGRPTVYFDTAAMLLLLVTLGRYLEARARAEAGASVRANVAPGGRTARRVRGAELDEVAVDDLAPGDVVEVSPGGAVPTDGVVLEGEAGVDESMLTGESRLVAKEPGAAVAGGTCSVDGRLRIRVTASAAESATARIEALLVAARRQRSRAERVADAAAAVITPVLLAVAAGAGAWWAMHEGTERGVLVAIAVLVVACPCGLGIATPVAVWMGLRTAARRGIVVRSAPALERLADVRSVLFDKTGTVTEPQASLVGVVMAPGAAIGEHALVARCAALEAGIPHPLARAIAAAAGRPGCAPLAPGEVRVVPGRGVAGIVAGRRLVVGSTRLAEAELDPKGRRDLAALAARVEGGSATAPDARGGCAGAAGGPSSCAFVVEDGRLLGGLRFAEALRPGAAAAMAALRASGASVGLLTGDSSAAAVVPGVFRADEVVAGLSPAGKVEHLRRLRSATPAGPPIAMVGDGINDAPALAGADVGIAVAGATDLARLTADVAILTGDLGAVPWLLAQARRVRAVARQNLVWAFGYNLVAVGLAAAGRLTPLVASLAMIASSLAVVANARRLGGEARRGRSGRGGAGVEVASGGFTAIAPAIAARPASRAAAATRLGVAAQGPGSNSSAAELMQ